MNEREINQKAAEEICHRLRFDAHEFRLGEWVALLDGKVVAVAIDLSAAVQSLR